MTFIAAVLLTIQEKDYVDVHMHLWGNEGALRPAPTKPMSKKDYGLAAKNLLEQMGKCGVKQALIMTLVEDKELFGAVQKLMKDHPGRFVLAGGGDVLGEMLQNTAADKVTADVKEKFAKEARSLADKGVKAFGEMLTTHLSFNERHKFVEIPPDHPLFLTLAEVAAEKGVAIDLHMEAIEKETPRPPGMNDKNPATLKPTIPSFERLLKHNRKARIVWQHIGWDNTGGMTIELLRRLLKENENLFMALRVEERPMMMDRKTPMPNRIVDKDGKVKAEWVKLLEEFPDRFVIGSDEFVGTSKDPSRAPQSFEETWVMVGQLKPELAAKVGRENAVRIYDLK